MAALISLPGRALAHAGRTAILAREGAFTYRDLIEGSARVAGRLLGDAEDLAETRVALLAPPSYHHVAAQWGVWRAGGVVVPLGVTHPEPELAHAVQDSGAAVVLAHPELAGPARAIASPAGVRLLTTEEALAAAPLRPLPDLAPGRRAMIVYTSGTTGRPKGVVTTHANLQAQLNSLETAWGWTADDRILLVLPLHHIHGIVNVLTSALWSGACCEMHSRFEAEAVWSRIAAGGLTLFMAVPTTYTRLIQSWEAAPPARQREFSEAASRLRLAVSGSAALPAAVFRRWREIAGRPPLERYGMTEIGMALSNPLHGERAAGFVGTPLPGVEVRLVDESGAPAAPDVPGEIQVRGPGVFLEYWGRPEETVRAFQDGWFRTGDVAVVEDGRYRILGRKSVDILKSGGHKVSCLEIEETLRDHAGIEDCAVVGVPDPEWGDRVCAAVEPRPGSRMDPASLQDWARARLAPYKVPRSLRVVEALPRNAMGKVSKRQVAEMFR